MSADTVSREEFAMLRDQVAANAGRLDAIDRGGTRGVGALSVQITEVIKDVSGVQRDLADFRRDHAEQHDREQAARVVTRRWLIGTIIAGFVALEAPLAVVVTHLH